MWFDEEETNSCLNCKYGNKDIAFKKCDNCLLTYSLTGEKYVDWCREEKKRGSCYDLLIQWYTGFREIFTYCKGYLLEFKKRFSRDCKFFNQYREN